MKKVNMIFREKKPLFWMALAFVMMIGVLSLCVWPDAGADARPDAGPDARPGG